jgi:hypothetical protein
MTDSLARSNDIGNERENSRIGMSALRDLRTGLVAGFAGCVRCTIETPKDGLIAVT